MQTLTTAKVITPVIHRENGRVEIEYRAEFDGNLIGFFSTQHQAECEINQYVLLLCEQGLVDQPLALQAEQALLNANPLSTDPWDDGPSQEEQAASAARWTECEGGWEQYTPHPFDEAKTVRLFQPRLFTADPSPSEPSPDLNNDDGMPKLPNMCAPAIVRKVIIAWHKERTQCAYWLAAFSDADRRTLAEAVVSYRAQFYSDSELTAERLLADWARAIADGLPPRPAAAARAA